MIATRNSKIGFCLRLVLLSGLMFVMSPVLTAQDVTYQYDGLGRLKTATYSGNLPPAITGSIGTQTYDTGASVNIQAAQVFSDPEGQALSYVASNLPAGVSINAGTGLISGSTSIVGTRTISVTATDPAGASTGLSFTLQIDQAPPVNHAPVVNPLLPDRSVFIGQTVTVNLGSHFSDPDGDPLTYSYSGSNGGTSISGSTLIMAPAGFGAPRDITIVASDGSLSVSDTFRFTILQNGGGDPEE